MARITVELNNGHKYRGKWEEFNQSDLVKFIKICKKPRDMAHLTLSLGGNKSVHFAPNQIAAIIVETK
jgi:hypothetical protein